MQKQSAKHIMKKYTRPSLGGAHWACCTPGHQMLDGRELFQGFAGIPYHLVTAGILRYAEVIFSASH